jgi:hypothetical protein
LEFSAPCRREYRHDIFVKRFARTGAAHRRNKVKQIHVSHIRIDAGTHFQLTDNLAILPNMDKTLRKFRDPLGEPGKVRSVSSGLAIEKLRVVKTAGVGVTPEANADIAIARQFDDPKFKRIHFPILPVTR